MLISIYCHRILVDKKEIDRQRIIDNSFFFQLYDRQSDYRIVVGATNQDKFKIKSVTKYRHLQEGSITDLEVRYNNNNNFIIDFRFFFLNNYNVEAQTILIHQKCFYLYGQVSSSDYHSFSRVIQDCINSFITFVLFREIISCLFTITFYEMETIYNY